MGQVRGSNNTQRQRISEGLGSLGTVGRGRRRKGKEVLFVLLELPICECPPPPLLSSPYTFNPFLTVIYMSELITLCFIGYILRCERVKTNLGVETTLRRETFLRNFCFVLSRVSGGTEKVQ